MANPLRPPIMAAATPAPAPAPSTPAAPAGFNWMDVVSAPQESAMPQPSGRYTREYLQEAQRAAQQLDQNELAQRKMMELDQYVKGLSQQNPRFQRPVTMASDVTATPAFYSDDPNVNQAMAQRTFTAMRSMPPAPLFQMRGQEGQVSPDQAYSLAQEIASARGFDPMGREAAAIYGGVADRILAERYNDALQARNAYGMPVDSTANYIDMTSINPSVTPRMTDPQAMNMSRWFGQDRERLRGQDISAYIPKSLLSGPQVPEIFQRDPLTVNIQRSKPTRKT